MSDRPRDLVDRFRDARSRRVVFVSHCVLNENVRVEGIGIDGSPSCGVTRTLDLRRSLPIIASSAIDRDALNRQAIAACVTPGAGMFFEALRRELRRRHLEIPFLEFDLVAEIRGDPRPITLVRSKHRSRPG